MNHFKSLPIDKNIFIIASGESRNEIPLEDYERIKEKYFVIGINFVDNIVPHARIWSDKNVSRYLQDTDKDCLWISRLTALSPQISKDMSETIDYWFNDKEEGFPCEFYYKDGTVHGCKWTLYWLLQLLRKYYTDKKVYITGMDCLDNKSYRFNGKEVEHVPNSDNNCEMLPFLFEERSNKDPGFFRNTYNCSFLSAVQCMGYMDYKGLIDGN